MKRELFTEDHELFRDNFRKFCSAEIKPHQEEWLKAGISFARDMEKGR